MIDDGDSIGDSLEQLQYIGTMWVTSDNQTIQRSFLPFSTEHQYGMPVIWNNSLGSLWTDHNEMKIVVTPRIMESQ